MATTPDTEFTLAHGPQRAVVSPWGAALRRYVRVDPDGETEVLWGYAGAANKKGGQGDVLIPFPGRIAHGRYEFEGRTFQLDCNDKEGPNAIHGFLRGVPWTVKEAAPDRIVFSSAMGVHEYRGYPFSLAVEVGYTLHGRGLSCAFVVLNTGESAAPVGVGFHPYFTVGTPSINEAEVTIPATHYLEFGETLTPTGNVLALTGSPWDYRVPRRVGDTRFNHCFINLLRESDGTCTVTLSNPRTRRCVRVIMDEAFTALVVYTGDAIVSAPRRALAIEPMTCATDAFNHPEWGLARLAPGARLEGRFTIQDEPGSR